MLHQFPLYVSNNIFKSMFHYSVVVIVTTINHTAAGGTKTIIHAQEVRNSNTPEIFIDPILKRENHKTDFNITSLLLAALSN